MTVIPTEQKLTITETSAIAMAQLSIDGHPLSQEVGETLSAAAAESDVAGLAAWFEFMANRGDGLTVPGGGITESSVTLGRFQVQDELGRGGFGIVVRAFDPDLQRMVALKIPRPERLLAGQPLEDYVREGQVAAQLEHPNIVRVYEAGRWGAIWYIAAEYCQGPNLAQWLDVHAPQMSAQLAATLMVQIADAVDYAHARGVLHLDLKPANILMSATPLGTASVQPKVTDFGLAGRRDTIATAGKRPVAGTLLYMAPEQVLGDTTHVGVGTDVFALGALLYDMLRPLAAVTLPALRENGQEIVDSLQTLRPPAILVSKDIDAICQKCLQCDPSARYASASEFARDLRRFLSGEPVIARPTSVFERLSYAARRRPLVAAAVSLTTVTILASSVLIIRAWRRAEVNLVALRAEQSLHAETAGRMDASLLNLTWLMQQSELQPKAGNDHSEEALTLVRDFYREITSWTLHASTDTPHQAVLAAGHSLKMLEDIRTADRKQLDEDFLAGLAAWKKVVDSAPKETKWRRAIALHVLFYCQKSPTAGVIWWRHPDVRGPQMAPEVIDIVEEPFAFLSIDLAKKLIRASDRERAQTALQNAILLLEERQNLPDADQRRSCALLEAYTELLGIAYRTRAAEAYQQIFEKAVTLADRLGSEARNSPRLAEAIGETFRLRAKHYAQAHDTRATLDANLHAIEFVSIASQRLPADTYVAAKLADLRWRTANLYSSLGEHSQAFNEFLKAFVELDEMISRFPRHRALLYHRAAVLQSLAQYLLESGDQLTAELVVSAAIADYEQNPPSDRDARTLWKHAITCYQLAGRLYVNQQRRVEAAQAYRHSQILLDQAIARFGNRPDYTELAAKNRRAMSALPTLSSATTAARLKNAQ